MEKDTTDSKPVVPDEEVPQKDIKQQEKEEPEYVGLPDRDLKKNLGCG